jgi:hypothetical protein
MKTFTWGGMFVGSFVGGLVPSLWGADSFSLAGVVLTAVGGAIGIFAGYYVGTRLGL